MLRRRHCRWWRLRGSSEAAGYRDVADGERGAATAVDELARVHALGVVDGERGAATAVDELARVHAPGVTDGERGTATAVVLVVELSRDCNEITLWGSPRANSPLNL